MLMSKLLRLALNDVRIEFSEPSTLVFFLVLPLIFTAVVGAGLSTGDADPNADNRIPVLLVDQDGSALSAELATVMEQSDVIRPVPQSQEEAEETFAESNVPALVSIPSGFGQALLAGQPATLDLRQAADDNRVLAAGQAVQAAASQVSNAVLAAHASVSEAERIRPFESNAERQAYFDQALSLAGERLASPPARVEVTRPAETNVQRIASGFEQGSAGQLVTWVLITLIGAAEVFVNERLGGTLRRLVMTPTSKATLLIGKLLGRLGLGVVQMVLLIGAGALLFKVDWGRSPLALVLVVLSFGLAAVGLGLLLGTFAKTRSQASGLTILASMLTAALGGAWWPLEVTPPVYQSVVKVLPTTWAMMGFNDVIVRGQGVGGVLPEIGVLLGFALLFLTLGIIRFRYE